MTTMSWRETLDVLRPHPCPLSLSPTPCLIQCQGRNIDEGMLKSIKHALNYELSEEFHCASCCCCCCKLSYPFIALFCCCCCWHGFFPATSVFSLIIMIAQFVADNTNFELNITPLRACKCVAPTPCVLPLYIPCTIVHAATGCLWFVIIYNIYSMIFSELFRGNCFRIYWFGNVWKLHFKRYTTYFL